MIAVFPNKQLLITSQDLSASEGHVNHSLKMSLDLVSSLELRAFTPPKTYMQPDGVTVAE